MRDEYDKKINIFSLLKKKNKLSEIKTKTCNQADKLDSSVSKISTLSSKNNIFQCSFF